MFHIKQKHKSTKNNGTKTKKQKIRQQYNIQSFCLIFCSFVLLFFVFRFSFFVFYYSSFVPLFYLRLSPQCIYQGGDGGGDVVGVFAEAFDEFRADDGAGCVGLRVGECAGVGYAEPYQAVVPEFH